MSRTDIPDYSTENCPIAASLVVLGEKWTLLVLRDAFYGVRRFEDMYHRIGAPRQVLSARLARLVDEGVLRRVPYREPGSGSGTSTGSPRRAWTCTRYLSR